MTLPATVTTTCSWSDHQTTRLGPFQEGGDLFAFGIDKTTNRVRAYRSQDLGHTWAEVDSGTTRSTSSTASHKTADACRSGSTVWLAVATSTSALSIYVFDLATAAWGTTLAGPTITLSATTGWLRYFLTRFVTGGTASLALFYEGATESVMGTAYTRVKLHLRDMTAGTWAGPYDVQGSATTPPANTLPGTQAHLYALHALGAADRLVVWWQSSEGSGVQPRLRTFAAGQFEAAPALLSQTFGHSALPAQLLGTPTTYDRPAGGIGMAVPFAMPGGLWAMRAFDAGDFSNASLWIGSQITTDAPETVRPASPGVLAADGERLWAWEVTDAQGLRYANNQGAAAGTWNPSVDWKATGTALVAGIGAARTTDGLGVLYYDGAAGALRYDRVVVLSELATRAVGLTEGQVVYLGATPPERIEVTLEAGPGDADPAGAVSATVSGSWDGGASWTPLAEAGPYTERVTDTMGIPAPPPWIKVDTNTEAADSVSGVAGVEG